MFTRRRFLPLSAAVVAAAAFPKRLFAEQRGTEIFTNASLGAYVQGELTQANFERHIGEVFTAFHSSGDVSRLTLRTVQAFTPVTAGPGADTNVRRAVSPVKQPASPAVSSFNATFAVSGKPVAQESLLLDHGTMGQSAAFVVPGQSANGEANCAATFTYLAGASSLSPRDMLRPTLMPAQ